MKNLTLTYLAAFTFILSTKGYSQQNSVTSIEKNVHDAAIGLEQYLNATLDTLTLKNDIDILKVTFLKHNEEGSETIAVGSRIIKIPLYHFKKGRYTIVVYTAKNIIALGANRISEISMPENAIADLEESILRSSLTEKEQMARHIKPLENKKQNLREDNSNVALVTPNRERRLEEEVSKQITKKSHFANQKRAFALALEKQERERAQRNLGRNTNVDNEREDQAIVLIKKKEALEGTSITIKKVIYNLSKTPSKNGEKQSRQEYRKNNLRPNGTKYQD